MLSSLKNKKYLRVRFLILILIPFSILFSLEMDETATSSNSEGAVFQKLIFTF